LSETTHPLREVIQSGKPQTAQVQLRHIDGRWFPVELMSAPLIDHDGSLLGVAEIFRKIAAVARKTRISASKPSAMH
jgi:hypothetical protein